MMEEKLQQSLSGSLFIDDLKKQSNFLTCFV